MSAKIHNFKFCRKCKQEVNFGEYKTHKRLSTKYQNNFLVGIDYKNERLKIKYANGYTLIDRSKKDPDKAVKHTCKSCKRSKGNIVGIKLDH